MASDSPPGRRCDKPFSNTSKWITIEHADTAPMALSARKRLRHKKSLSEVSTVGGQDHVYADEMNLKLETSFRGAPDDDDVTELNGILTYKIRKLIQQKLKALNGRTAARDLHDVIYLYENLLNDFGEEELDEITTLYNNQSSILDEYNSAYNEDTILSTSNLLEDLTKLVDLYQERSPE